MKNLHYSYRVVRVSKLLGSKSPVTDWFLSSSEANASCSIFTLRFKDYKTFYFVVERKIEKS